MLCGYLSPCISPLFCWFVLQCRVLAAPSLPGTRFKHSVRAPNFPHLHRLIKDFESKEPWILDIWEWPRFWICFVKHVFVQLSKCEANAFSVSINLRGLSDVRVCSLMFYDVRFRNNVWFQGIGPCSLRMGK